VRVDDRWYEVDRGTRSTESAEVAPEALEGGQAIGLAGEHGLAAEAATANGQTVVGLTGAISAGG